jgi:hypothetical protein
VHSAFSRSLAIEIPRNQSGVPGAAPATHRIGQTAIAKIHQWVRGVSSSVQRRIASGSQNGEDT